MKYYPIDESAARRAKQANSLSDYAEGSATSEYRREIDRAATLAEECKKGKTEAQQDKIDYLLDRYARRLGRQHERIKPQPGILPVCHGRRMV